MYYVYPIYDLIPNLYLCHLTYVMKAKQNKKMYNLSCKVRDEVRNPVDLESYVRQLSREGKRGNSHIDVRPGVVCYRATR